MPGFAAAVFLSAFLLFQVQPLLGKTVLPWFGGTPNVWATCLLFFQGVLLLGYLYAHLLRRFAPRVQAGVHLAVLGVGVVFAVGGILPGDAWKPTGDERYPAWQILALLGACVGVPYFVVSTTGPLLQAWFAASRPGQSPYRLYALSNVGSLLALATFPTVFERYFAASTMARMWAGGFVAFAALCGWRAWRLPAEAAAPEPCPAAAPLAAPGKAARPDLGSVLLWLALAMCGSVLLSAGTNTIAHEISMVPFLYVLPLGLYLLSFILCFDSERWYGRWVGAAALVAGAGALWLLHVGPDADMGTQLVGFNLAIFLGCMSCHGELARRKPAPAHLTLFFLVVSLGGVLGGALVCLAAPNVLIGSYEFPLALAASALLFATSVLADLKSTAARLAWSGFGLALGAIYVLAGTALAPPFDGWASTYGVWLLAGAPLLGGALTIARRSRPVGWGLFAATALGFSAAAFCRTEQVAAEKHRESEWLGRNFFGTLEVARKFVGTEDEAKWLFHGRIEHGMQYDRADLHNVPTHYFVEASGLGTAILRHPRRTARPPQSLRVGVIGLGAGMIATYAQPGDYFAYYDINPLVEYVARNHFDYLANSPALPLAEIGDARIVLERQLREGRPEQFDVLVVDAFSSDAIPTHLLTKECFGTYLQHLRNPDEGIVVLHISNRYLALERVGRALAKEFKMDAAPIETKGEEWEGPRATSSAWVLLTRNRTFLNDAVVLRRRLPWNDENPQLADDDPHKLYQLPLPAPWTDDRTDLFAAVNWPQVEDSMAASWRRVETLFRRHFGLPPRRPPAEKK